LWALAAQNILINPVFGSHVTTEFGYEHNLYLETFIATGLVGLTLLLVPISVCSAISKLKETWYYSYNYTLLFIFVMVIVLCSGTVYSSSFFLFASISIDYTKA